MHEATERQSTRGDQQRQSLEDQEDGQDTIVYFFEDESCGGKIVESPGNGCEDVTGREWRSVGIRIVESARETACARRHIRRFVAQARGLEWELMGVAKAFLAEGKGVCYTLHSDV